MNVMNFKRYYEIVCRAYKDVNDGCLNCPLCQYCTLHVPGLDVSRVTSELVKIVTNIVENGLISRQQLFLEQYPNAEMTPDGSLVIPPCVIDPSQRQTSICTNEGCEICGKKFWAELIVKPIGSE